MLSLIPTQENIGRRYEQRLLAYIDILGWSGLIEKSKNDPSTVNLLASTTGLLRMTPEAIRGGIPGVALGAREFQLLDLQAAHFSDTLVVSAPAQHAPAVALVGFVQSTCHHLLVGLGCYTRGAIVAGDLFHRSDVVYGPAILDAYNLERDVAVYPRILIAPEALVIVQALGVNALARTDFDGMAHLDIFRCPGRSPTECSEWATAARTVILGKIKDDGSNLKHLAKHQWFMHYLDSLPDPEAR